MHTNQLSHLTFFLYHIKTDTPGFKQNAKCIYHKYWAIFSCIHEEINKKLQEVVTENLLAYRVYKSLTFINISKLFVNIVQLIFEV